LSSKHREATFRGCRSPDEGSVLHESLTANRDAVIERARTKVALRSGRAGAQGIPVFLDQLIETLEGSPSSGAAIAASADQHGVDLLHEGLTLAQVVHDYCGVCEAATELAHEAKAFIGPDEFHICNQCLGEAIAHAVTEYSYQRDRTIAAQETERLGELAHELRNALGPATMAFHMLRTGTVGLEGSTAALLGRSLAQLTKLVTSSLTQVRLDARLETRERVSVREFIDELQAGATLEAVNAGRTLSVTSGEPGIEVIADRQLLGAAVFNLLQNAFKFSRRGGHVALNTSSAAGRVLFDVEDECGGLPAGTVDTLFRPYNQQSTRRVGLGLGLSITRKSVEANGGEVRVRDVPGVGCVFTIDLPRIAAAR
jgi:signal transduction histidine kinase